VRQAHRLYRFPFFVFRFSLKRPNHFGEFQAVFGAFESENDVNPSVD
jgi:hypothetical protein